MAEDPEGKGTRFSSEIRSREDNDRRFRAEQGINLLREVESEICGPHVSEFPEVAEGLSLTTDRTAVICLKEDVPSRKLLPGVYHFQIPTKWSSFYRDSVMLAPVSFQEAVDLCLASHTLGDWTRRPVVCIHRAMFAQTYGKVVFPSPRQIAGAAEVDEGEKSRLSPDMVMEQLAILRERTGGDIDALRISGDPDAPTAVVIPGLAPARLRKMLAARQDIKVISITLLNPFPLERIMDLVGEAEKVVLMLPRKNPFHKRIFSNLKFYLGERFDREVWTESVNGVSFEITPPLLEGDKPDIFPEENRFRLGVSSSGEGAGRLLKNFAAECPLCHDGEFGITVVERCDLTILTSGEDPGTPDCDRELDLLVVDLSEGKRAEAGLRLLKRGGHLVLIGDLTRLEGLAEDMAVLKDLRQTNAWKIWTGSDRLDRSELIGQLAGLMFGDQVTGDKNSDSLQRISGESLERKIRERRKEISQINGSLRFPDEAEKSADAGDWKGIIREFFLTGSCPEDIYTSVDFSSPALPAILHKLDREKVFETGYPLLAVQENGNTDYIPVRSYLEGRVDDDYLPGLIKAFAGALERKTRAVCKLDESLIKRALEIFTSGLANGREGSGEVAEKVRQAFSSLAETARMLTFSRAVLPLLCHSIASEKRTEKRKEFRREVSLLRGQLGDILEAEERSQADADAGEVADEMGDASGRFLDPEAMAQLHHRHMVSPGFAEERKEELQWAYKVLTNYLEVTEDSPEAYFVFDRYTYEAFPLPGVSVQTHDNPFLFAAGIFDGLAEGLVEVLKAVQLARRETESDGGSVSDSLTEKLDWTFLEMEELSLIPPVVVLISSESVFEKRLSSLGRLISSGRPVAVLITSREFDVTGDEVWPKHSGISPDLWQLVLSFRELFVIQSSLALPLHTIKGMREWISQPVPSVALVAVPRAGGGGFEEWWRSYAACLGRAVPVFRHDPSDGPSWKERINLEGNVLPEEPWIRKEFEVKTSSGEVRKMEDAITPAHAAVLKARFSGHFLTIPEEAWDDNQIEFREYLDRGILLEPDTIPFIWVLSRENVLKRAILTRDVVYACQERGRSWRMLQQLAGVPEPGIEDTEVPQEQPREIGEADLKAAREQGASQVIDRLIEVLAGSSSTLLEAPLVPSSIKGAEDVKIREAEEKEKDLEEEEPSETLAVLEEDTAETEEELSEEPYIESELCTSCNECISLNSSMFQYNSNKQAYVADPGAGTYRQLVTAAENCPARCIYPGTPRPDDETATEELIARAKAIH